MRFSALASNLSTDPREAIALSRTTGFDGLLFDSRTTSLDLVELSQTGRREFRHLLSSHAQAIVGLRVDLGANGLGPKADIDRALSRLDDVLHVTADLGANTVCVDVGTLVPESDAAIAALCAIADRYQTIVAISSAVVAFEQIDRAITTSRCPWLGVDLDTVALIRDAWPSDQTFARLGSHVRHVRARDAVLGADNRVKFVPIGSGGVEWPIVVASLDASSFNGWTTIDATEMQDRQRSAADGLAKLRAIAR